MPRRSLLALTAAGFLALGLQGRAQPEPQKGFIYAFTWVDGQAGFGGFSALEVIDATHIVVLNDSGAQLRATLTRDAEGRIIAARAGPMTPLKARGSTPLLEDRSDSEGLARAPDGSFYVSFEKIARVLRYPALDGPAQSLPTPREFHRFEENSALEALAVDAAGVLYAIPERAGPVLKPGFLAAYYGSDDEPPFPVYRFARGAWDQPFAMRRDGGFLPVAADFGPEGRLYVMERQFHGLSGFATRVRSFRVAPDGMTDERVVLESPVGLHDNMEGLSVWRDPAGDVRLTMISDDNFNPLQRTEIVEYRVPG